jgi:hypothetical protein
MALILTDEQKVKLSVGFFTKAGNPAKIDGLPTWASSDPSIITVQVTVSADADLGEGTRLITGVLDIEVRAAEAVSANIAAGTPESK